MSDPYPAKLPRAVALEIGSNLRDLGGWTTADGRTVRSGRVFRSAALVRLSAADEAAVGALGLRTVCDLRGAAERAAAPVVLAGADSVALSIEPTVGISLRDLLTVRQATAADARALMRRAYVAYAHDCKPQYRRLFALLQEPGRLPLMFHCSAGKDRTGFAAAALLAALGVGWEQVLEDYLATTQHWRRDTLPDRGLPPAIAEVMLSVEASLLEAGFAAMRETADSVEAYLEQALGVDAAARERLRALLLD
ncbi:MAG TPA: tyrosine-protein phosphatase [Acetobacteraceae bacterium]|jgi:protein-tyrosine phosphatase|nr:tyrosine-protein phosphatase [Acetobacteraceae bacterium]